LRCTQETPKTKTEELPDKVRPDEPTRAQTKAEELPDKVCSDEPPPPSIVPTTVEQRPASGYFVPVSQFFLVFSKVISILKNSLFSLRHRNVILPNFLFSRFTEHGQRKFYNIFLDCQPILLHSISNNVLFKLLKAR